MQRVSIPHRQAKNDNNIICISNIVLFQFLIGRLKTRYIQHVSHSFFKVSIPHRQAKNDALHSGEGCDTVVSIPHRQAKNELTALLVSKTVVVSIPHRQAKNWDREKQTIRDKKFQFLIGRLKTEMKKLFRQVTF